VKGVGVCPYCKSDELVFHTKQLRAADEPATIFYRCIKCKSQWRG
jgi:DNA-directed RNA polymerase subunit M/transcription elongation factor TFIIS